MLEAGTGIEHSLTDQSGPRSPLKPGAKVNGNSGSVVGKQNGKRALSFLP
jgi:hypothetical protein